MILKQNLLLNTFCVAILFDALWATLMKDLKNVDRDLPTLKDENLTKTLSYGNQTYDDKTTKQFYCTQYDILRIKKDLIDLFLIRPKPLLTS